MFEVSNILNKMEMPGGKNYDTKMIPILLFLAMVNLKVFSAPPGEIVDINIESNLDFTRVIIDLLYPVEFKMEKVEESNKIQLDLKNCKITNSGTIYADDGKLKFIEVHQMNPETVRVVLYLQSIDNTEDRVFEDKNRLIVDLFEKKEERRNGEKEEPQQTEAKSKDRLFLMGIGMLRLNWTKVRGNEIRFRYSDLGLPPDFSTRERASFVIDGTYGGGEYKINGQFNYDPENRITEPPLEFLINTGKENLYFSGGDIRGGFFIDSIFPRYYHPFRGAILGARSKSIGFELIGGMSRGSAEIEELIADAGAGPYYFRESPIIRGSEIVFLVAKSAVNPDIEVKRTPLQRNRDYFIDYDRGAIIFNYPVYPYDELGNPIYIVVSYQFESLIGRFTRDVMGFRTFLSPSDSFVLSYSYVADSDGKLNLGDAWKQKRSLYSFGLKIDTKILNFLGEYSISDEPSLDKTNGFFGGGVLNLRKDLHLYFNGWKVDQEFSTFANEQLKYGYGLQQIFPELVRTVFLSPFQFARNLGAELYPFSLSRVSVGEEEAHAFLEYEKGKTDICGGAGWRKELLRPIFHNLLFLSTFHNGEKTKLWLKGESDREYDKEKRSKDSSDKVLLLGLRQRVWSGEKGEIYLQADYLGDSFDDFLDISYDSIRHTGTLFLEYLTENEGIFGGYRKELLLKKGGEQLLNADIYETGIRKHLSKIFFLDSRFRLENSAQQSSTLDNRIISLGGGIETQRFRAMGRYEIQMNKSDGREGRRRLWSIFLMGSPFKDFSISLRYYKQFAKSGIPSSLSERAEEELSARILWRVSKFLSLYSQWRYDTNFELLPPLDRTRGNSLASVDGLKINFTKRMDLLANYKLIKVWGPIENRKESFAGELGYLIWKHFRFAIGAEKIDFNDRFNPEGNYNSTVGYFKLVALY